MSKPNSAIEPNDVETPESESAPVHRIVLLRFERWKDFAFRMAETCWDDDDTTPPRDWVVGRVKDFMREIEDSSVEQIARFRSWDQTDNSELPKDQYGRSPIGPYICDWFSEWESDNVYYQFRELATDLELRWADIHDDIFGDDEMIREEVTDRWGSPVACCVRAGMDCAFEPSMGVLGFTAGDLRRMYPDGVPGWVTGDEPWDTIPIDAVVPGVGFVPGKPVPNGRFDELPDDAGVWL